MNRLMDWIAGRLGYVPAESWAGLQIMRQRHALEAIIAQDTPNGNATVKRMVKIARDGLGGAA